MPTAHAIVAECDFPPQSLMDRRWVSAAYFRDSYRVAIRSTAATPISIFHAVLAHHPWWIKAVLIVRNRFVILCGLSAPTPAEAVSPAVKESYCVGETIGV